MEIYMNILELNDKIADYIIRKLKCKLIKLIKLTIIIEKREDDYKAHINGDLGIYGLGNNPSEAVYDLLNMNITNNGLPGIKYVETRWDLRHGE